ncbi:restriction endonuclease subunit M [Streptomyces sp. NPDC057245]|uniref:restriction endonuclease subunit M n=1 Tax=Streptomyces TaxID=1883 RepID=UPI001C1E8942|nr:N-6 DNA methylase [Streptomyces sp. A108]MBU6529813.1 N-6 DNA methylase [Streptomyces sp. A108]
MSTGLTLVCPVRGRLKAKARSKDGLTPSEERYRVEALRHIVDLGYPVANIRVEPTIKKFGNSGRNSFRADFAVLDVPVSSIKTDDVAALLSHAVILGEVKRDNASFTSAVSYQVKPMLDFAGRDDCVALYWDDVEQRVFWIERKDGSKQYKEGPLSDLPGYGKKPKNRSLTFNTIDPSKPLIQVFERIEDILHSSSVGPSKRFNVMLQLLLIKLYDEQQHQNTPDAALTIQDFAAAGVSASVALGITNGVLGKSVDYYQRFLPEKVDDKLPISGDLLLEVLRVLAPVRIVSMSRALIQEFYMYFAKHIYKWDLAQYFTPVALTEFIVDILNPQFGEHVKDPACGSADFLTAAFRRGQHWPDYASSIWGSDVSPEAVQVAVLNMILNGDGKTNIQQEDSLQKINSNENSADVVVCNPPFGTRIVETKANTLENFDLGREWVANSRGILNPSKQMLAQQESGILFAEACVKLMRPGGRMALVVPNGYLGNRSARYTILREFLLRHCYLSAIVALPRFTFKGSGADVSASVLFCEKRVTPLTDAKLSEEYDFCVEVVDRVGWVTGDKRGKPTYLRDEEDGTLVLDEYGNPILDSDFADRLLKIRNSSAGQEFPWLVRGHEPDPADTDYGWSVSISSVVNDPHLTLDPKRLCRKFVELQDQIKEDEYFRIGDIVDVIPEKTDSSGQSIRFSPAAIYRHVEIQDVEVGTYRSNAKRGWELPQRARHLAKPGDVFVGGIRNSVRKWFLAGEECANVVVTNGMHRLHLKDGCEEYLVDLVAGLCSEAYRVQMRALARGADGLAEIAVEDLKDVVLPRITDPDIRSDVEPFVQRLVVGASSLEEKVESLMADGALRYPNPPTRPDHTSLV